MLFVPQEGKESDNIIISHIFETNLESFETGFIAERLYRNK